MGFKLRRWLAANLPAFELEEIPQEGDHSTQEVPQAGPSGPPLGAKRSPQRGTHSLISPSKDPSSSGCPSYLTRIAAVTGADDDEAEALVEKFKAQAATRGKPIANIGGYIASMPDDHLREHLAELRATTSQEAMRTDRSAFMAHIQVQAACEHGYPGGHIPFLATGWMACPIQRRRTAPQPVG